jgi:dCMP deaminase
MNEWDDRFFDLADMVGSWSKDPSTKVGAVIIRPDRTIASVGYNGFPRGVDDSPEIYADRPTKYMRIVHGEANAILSAREPLHGYTLYVTPLHPCATCSGLIIQAGIKVVNYSMSKQNIRNEAWQQHYEQMTEMFLQAGIRYYGRYR